MFLFGLVAIVQVEGPALATGTGIVVGITGVQVACESTFRHLRARGTAVIEVKINQ